MRKQGKVTLEDINAGLSEADWRHVAYRLVVYGEVVEEEEGVFSAKEAHVDLGYFQQEPDDV